MKRSPTGSSRRARSTTSAGCIRICMGRWWWWRHETMGIAALNPSYETTHGGAVGWVEPERNPSTYRLGDSKRFNPLRGITQRLEDRIGMLSRLRRLHAQSGRLVIDAERQPRQL